MIGCLQRCRSSDGSSCRIFEIPKGCSGFEFVAFSSSSGQIHILSCSPIAHWTMADISPSVSSSPYHGNEGDSTSSLIPKDSKEGRPRFVRRNSIRRKKPFRAPQILKSQPIAGINFVLLRDLETVMRDGVCLHLSGSSSHPYRVCRVLFVSLPLFPVHLSLYMIERFSGFTSKHLSSSLAPHFAQMFFPCTEHFQDCEFNFIIWI